MYQTYSKLMYLRRMETGKGNQHNLANVIIN